MKYLFAIAVGVAIITRLVSAQLNKIESEDLKLVYVGSGLYYLAPYGVQTFETAIDFHKEIWDWEPTEDVVILLTDFSDEGNGGTLILPWNFVILYVAPFSHDFDVIPSNERIQWLMNHELTHVAVNDVASPADEFWRTIFFGKVIPTDENPLSMVYSYLTAPRWYSPRWYQEGVAVFCETWMNGGLGRAVGGYDETVFRTMVLDDSYFYDVVGLETEGTAIDFQVGVNSYLYGTRFVDYLAYEFGVDKLVDFYSRSDSSRKFYAAQFKNVYGIGIARAWRNWIEFEKAFQQNNLERIEQFPLTELRPITKKGLGSVSQAFFDEETNKIYCAINGPKKFAQIVSIDAQNGNIEKIEPVFTPKLRYVTQFCADFDSGILFASENNSNFRHLKSIDLDSRKSRILQRKSRVGDLTLNPADKSLWGIQTFSGRTTIVRAEPPYEAFVRIKSIPFGKVFFGLDFSPDGSYLAGAMSDPAGRQKLVAYETNDLLNGAGEYREIFEFEDNTASDFTFSKDGKYLFGTSYYTGVSNVFRVNFETGELAALSNVKRGLFRPRHIGGDSLLVWEFTTEGLRPAKMKIQPIDDVNAIEYLGQKVISKNPELEEWLLPSPSTADVDSTVAHETEYSTFANFELGSIYPIVEGFKDFPAYGIRANFADRLAVNSASISASYSPNPLLPKDQRTHLFLDYHYWNFNFKAGLNKANFYDLFGPTKVSRAGHVFEGSYLFRLVRNQKPRLFNLKTSAAYYGNLEALPDYQNVTASIDEMYRAEAELHYSFTRKSLGAIEPEAGIETKLILDASYAGTATYPRVYASADYGFLLPFKNSSLWFRSSAGAGFGEREAALSKFYFGGFGNNYVDRLQSRRYRMIESFPGVEINEIPALDFGKATIEFNLPPKRFERLGTLYLYATNANLSLFGSALAADVSNENYRRFVYDCGAQLELEIVFFSLLKTTLSFGAAAAFEEGRIPRDELMISLKLL